jgi:cyclophilin family peptidyl-prolyl cis-trans isomerase
VRILARMRLCFVLFCSCLAIPLGTWAGTLAQFRTVLGDIEVELFDANKPVTVTNFIGYVQSGAYRDIFIQRWEPGFVIQGGGFKTANRGQTNAFIDDVEPTFGSITNEYSVGRRFSNVFGTIAMARQSGVTNSASSQWFFNLTNNAFLDNRDGGFTVFGRVLRGSNVLQLFNNPSTNTGIFRVNVVPSQPGGPLSTVPVLSREPGYEDLIYVDITLLNVQVTPRDDGLQEIAWRSVSNQVNRVEFTTQFPPVWQELVQTNGTGSEIRVLDPESSLNNRFYRVRVDY